MRILYVTLQNPAMGQAGYTHVREIVDGLRLEGHLVDMVQPGYGRNNPNLINRLIVILWSIGRVWLKLLRNPPEIVYVRTPHPLTFLVTLGSRARKVPVVVEVVAPITEEFTTRAWLKPFKPLLVWLWKLDYLAANEIVAVSPPIADDARRLGRKVASSVHVVPNGANIDLMRPIADPDIGPYGLENQHYVIFVGALAAWQGIRQLIDATYVEAWPDDVKLLICGDGVMKGYVQNAVPDGIVIYPGVVSYEQVPELVSGSLAGLAPIELSEIRSPGSLSPLKVYEYLACGRPAIVSNDPGMVKLVEDGPCGLVLSENSPDGIAEAVLWVRANNERCRDMGKYGRKLVVENHSWAARAKATSQILLRHEREGQPSGR